tara:strand:+ start:4178 stop:4450 length:273 start_codon:yes stop_codon:yes gene_type:complete
MNQLKLKWQTTGDKEALITCKATSVTSKEYCVTIQVGKIPMASTIHIDSSEAAALREMLEEIDQAFVNLPCSTGEQVTKHGLSKMQAKRK